MCMRVCVCVCVPQAGLGCYLFNPGGAPDEAVVLDATYQGNVMRFVNHSCA
jgi:hypothetical protein